MATKKLSRTILQRGRTGYNQIDRKESHSKRRAQTKQWLSRGEEAIDSLSAPKNRPAGKKAGQTDLLNPVYRYIDKQVGRGWNNVYSELVEKFNVKSLAGWHVVETHIIGEVKGAGGKEYDPSWKSWRYYVDKNGILRKNDRPYKKTKKKPYYGPSLDQAKKWAKGRAIFDYGTTQFWSNDNVRYEPCPERYIIKDAVYDDNGVRISRASRTLRACPHEHREMKGKRHAVLYNKLLQGKELNRKDREYWARLSDEIREYLTGKDFREEKK